MDKDRRLDGRARFASTFANKYIEGIPHVVELLDVSASWRRGNREALRIVAADAVDRARLRKLIRETRAA